MDPLVVFKSLTIKRIPVEEPSARHPYYLSVHRELRDMFENRDKAELDEIERLVEAEQAKATEES
jgi:hypothetical protein